MAGLTAHIVRRGVDALRTQSSPDQAYVAMLQAQVLELENVKTLEAWQLAILILTVVSWIMIYFTAKYTIGEVISSLAMIEDSQSTTIVAVSDDPDAPLEKGALVELVKTKPLTASIRKTVARLDQLGGTARWRGLGVAILYNLSHGIIVQLLSSLFAEFYGAGPFGLSLTYVLSSIFLSRIRMTWTHVVVSLPSTAPWYKRVPRGSFYFRVLALPSLVYAVSQQLLVVLPAAVFLLFGALPSTAQEVNANFELCRFLATIGTALLVAFSVVLPASVTLTRIEASLLPDDQETVVTFDRSLGGAAVSAISLETLNVRGLFVAAWRTFDRAARLRLIKFYVKLAMIQIAVVMSFFFVVFSEIFAFGPDRVVTMVRSAHAAVQLAAMGEVVV